MKSLLIRITINPQVLNGKPCFRNMRFSVAQMLELLVSGMLNDEIIADYPYIEKDDIYACMEYTAKVFNK
jgi:uncharacterized protein (DUF433 family)